MPATVSASFVICSGVRLLIMTVYFRMCRPMSLEVRSNMRTTVSREDMHLSRAGGRMVRRSPMMRGFTIVTLTRVRAM